LPATYDVVPERPEAVPADPHDADMARRVDRQIARAVLADLQRPTLGPGGAGPGRA
jgi:hypothetical protein